MKMVFLMMASILLLRQDASVPTPRRSYELVEHLKIAWSDILKQPDDDYDVYFYSNGCQYCRDLEQDIVIYALGGHRPLYFIEVSPFLPFGFFTINCSCDISCLRLAAYPSLFVIEQGCVIDVIIGFSSIVTHYGF